MYKDIFGSIRNEAEKRNLREKTIQLYCSDVSYFLRWIKKPMVFFHREIKIQRLPCAETSLAVKNTFPD